MPTPTLEELTLRIAALETARGTLSTLTTQVDDINRQLQRLQGASGLLEPQSAISGWRLVGTSASAVNGVTYVGQAAQLLAGPGISFSRPANTPFLQITAGQGLMNADYVVASDGSGTHLTLFGTTGALETAIATGVDKAIWVCTTHTETRTTTHSISALAAGQNILVFSAGPYRPTITRGGTLTGTLMTHDVVSGAGSTLRFEGIRFHAATGSGTQDWLVARGNGSAAGSLPDIEIINVGFTGDSGATWQYLVNASIADTGGVFRSSVVGRFTMFKSQDLGSSVKCIVRLTNVSQSNGNFWMEGNEFLGLERIADRRDAPPALAINTAYIDWGHGGLAGLSYGIYIIDNRLDISKDAWLRTYNVPMFVVGNMIRGTNSKQTAAVDNPALFAVGTGGTTSPKDFVASGNYIIQIGTNPGGGVTSPPCFSVGGGAGTVSAVTIASNTLAGPGTTGSTAIQLDMAAESATDGYFVMNSYRDWTTNVGGAGASSAYSSIDHGGLGGLTDDDHTQYALLGGRAGSQTLNGGTGASENLILDSTANATKGAVRVYNASDLDIYSDAGVTRKGSWDGLTGHISLGVSTAPSATQVLFANETITDPAAAMISFNTALSMSMTANNANDFHSMFARNRVAGSFIASGLLVGVQADIFRVSGNPTVNDHRGFYATAVGGTGLTVIDRYGLYVANGIGAGSITNQYGVYIENMAKGGTLNRAIYSAGGQSVHVGSIRFGSTTAPTNITDGDVTALRLSLGNGATFGSAGDAGEVADIDFTSSQTTAAARAAISVNYVLSPSAASSTEFRAIAFSNTLTDANARTFNIVQGGYFENRLRQDGAVTEAIAVVGAASVIDSSSPATVGAVTTAISFDARMYNRPSGTSTLAITTAVGLNFGSRFIQSAGATITDLYNIRIQNPTTSTITTHYGIEIEKLTRATTNIEFRNAGKMIFTPTAQTLAAAGNTIGSSARLQDVDNSTGAPLTLTSTPTITAGVGSGQLLTVTNVDTADNVVLQDETGLAGSKLRLPGAAALTLGPKDSATFRWNSGAGEWWCIATANL